MLAWADLMCLICYRDIEIIAGAPSHLEDDLIKEVWRSCPNPFWWRERNAHKAPRWVKGLLVHSGHRRKPKHVSPDTTAWRGGRQCYFNPYSGVVRICGSRYTELIELDRIVREHFGGTLKRRSER